MRGWVVWARLNWQAREAGESSGVGMPHGYRERRIGQMMGDKPQH
jgi:hypothetical protein